MTSNARADIADIRRVADQNRKFPRSSFGLTIVGCFDSSDKIYVALTRKAFSIGGIPLFDFTTQMGIIGVNDLQLLGAISGLAD